MAGAFSSAFSAAFDLVANQTITDTDILQKPVDYALAGDQKMTPGKRFREYSGPNPRGVTYRPSNIARRGKTR